MKSVFWILFLVGYSFNIESMRVTRPLQAINPVLLKGTHTVLPDTNYAPFWGLVMIDKSVAEQIYDFSFKQQNKEIHALLSDVVEEDKQKEKESIFKYLSEQVVTATESLVSHLFHKAGNTFTLTNAPNNPMRQIMPRHIGTILRIVADEEGSKNYDSMQKRLLEYLVSLNFLDASGKPFKGKAYNPFVKAVISSLQECLSGMYIANMTQSILLGFMLAKSSTRKDIEDYFTGFEGKEVKLPDEFYAKSELEQLLQSTPDLQNVPKFADYVCAMMHQQMYANQMPKLAKQKLVQYQNQGFTDCVEVMMRNIVNIITYDFVDKKFGHAPADTTMNQSLQAYYANSINAESANVTNNLTNQSWVDVVENIPGVSYNNLLIKGTDHKVSSFSGNCSGFILVENIDSQLPVRQVNIGGQSYNLHEKRVGDQTYILVPLRSDFECYELMPGVSNIIVLLNRLFELKLYESEAEILQKDFIQKYFAKIWSKLGWQISDQELQNVLNNQYQKITIASKKDDTRFYVHLSFAHGYVSIPETENEDKFLLIRDQLNLATSNVQAVCVSLGAPWQDVVSVSKSIFYTNIKDLNHRRSILVRIFSNHDKRLLQQFVELNEQALIELIMSMTEAEDNYFRDFIDFHLNLKLQLPEKVKNAIINMHKIAYLKYKRIESLKQLIWWLPINEIWKRVDGMIKSKDNKDKNTVFVGVDLIKYMVDEQLIGRDQVSEIWKRVDEMMKSEGYYAVFAGVDLIKYMVDKQLIGRDQVSEIWKRVDEMMKSEDHYAVSVGVDLIKFMIDSYTIRGVKRGFVNYDLGKDIDELANVLSNMKDENDKADEILKLQKIVDKILKKLKTEKSSLGGMGSMPSGAKTSLVKSLTPVRNYSTMVPLRSQKELEAQQESIAKFNATWDQPNITQAMIQQMAKNVSRAGKSPSPKTPTTVGPNIPKSLSSKFNNLIKYVGRGSIRP